MRNEIHTANITAKAHRGVEAAKWLADQMITNPDHSEVKTRLDGLRLIDDHLRWGGEAGVHMWTALGMAEMLLHGRAGEFPARVTAFDESRDMILAGIAGVILDLEGAPVDPFDGLF